MRVISGEARGRKLTAALPPSVRPTTDRVKESLFNIVASLGGVEGAEVLDLFCGSGALGIEALSRGAAHVTFIDADRGALDAARANLVGVGLDPSLARFERAQLPDGQRRTADLVLADPPYDLVGSLDVVSDLEAELVVIESGTDLEAPEGWRHLRQRRYGTTVVTVMTPLETDEQTR